MQTKGRCISGKGKPLDNKNAVSNNSISSKNHSHLALKCNSKTSIQQTKASKCYIDLIQ